MNWDQLDWIAAGTGTVLLLLVVLLLLIIIRRW
jgi:hypothetical protein